MSISIAVAETAEEIDACYAVMSELRPHLQREDFVRRVYELSDIAGLAIVYLRDGAVKAVAGIRVSEWLAAGRYLEIEDLVTTVGARSAGYGSQLFDWIVAYARDRNCDQVRLLSRIDRDDAHRFYKRKGMAVEAFYFSMKLEQRAKL